MARFNCHNEWILNHYCTGLLQYGVIFHERQRVKYHPVLEKTSAMMDLFFFHALFGGVLDTKIPELVVFFKWFLKHFSHWLHAKFSRDKVPPLGLGWTSEAWHAVTIKRRPWQLNCCLSRFPLSVLLYYHSMTENCVVWPNPTSCMYGEARSLKKWSYSLGETEGNSEN